MTQVLGSKSYPTTLCDPSTLECSKFRSAAPPRAIVYQILRKHHWSVYNNADECWVCSCIVQWMPGHAQTDQNRIQWRNADQIQDLVYGRAGGAALRILLHSRVLATPLLTTRYWQLVTRYWSLTTGYRYSLLILATGYSTTGYFATRYSTTSSPWDIRSRDKITDSCKIGKLRSLISNWRFSEPTRWNLNRLQIWDFQPDYIFCSYFCSQIISQFREIFVEK